MITRIVKMTIRSDEQLRFAELFENHRHRISTMPGCHGLRLLTDTDKSGIFFTISSWQSDLHLEQYRNSDVFKSLWPQVKVLFNAPAEAWSLDEITTQQVTEI